VIPGVLHSLPEIAKLPCAATLPCAQNRAHGKDPLCFVLPEKRTAKKANNKVLVCCVPNSKTHGEH